MARLFVCALVCFTLLACSTAPSAVQPPPLTRPPGSTSTVPTLPTNSAVAQPTQQAAVASASPAATTSVTAVPTAQPVTQPTPTTRQTATSLSSELLFLRNGQLVALDPDAGTERVLTDQVREFAANAAGTRIAVVRSIAQTSEIWLLDRSGDMLRQLTSNQRAESVLSWSPDGLTLAYSSATNFAGRPTDWINWSSWCAGSEVRLFDLSTDTESSLAPGCDPAFAPDGRRIAFATPPQQSQPGLAVNAPVAENSIRLVNRQGQNGWNFASATPGTASGSLLVYGPHWSPDGQQLSYQRFIGYQALTDLGMSEVGDSFAGNGQPWALVIGWASSSSFSPDGQRLALVQYNFSDARGLTGWEIWNLTLIDLEGQRETFVPSGPMQMRGTQRGELARVSAVAWSPAGDRLAAVLPEGWRAGIELGEEPGFLEAGPGELWILSATAEPQRLLARDLEYATPLVWLPALTSSGQLVYPADWSTDSTQQGQLQVASASDGLRLMAIGSLPASSAVSAASLAPLLGAEAELGEAREWPDGSSYREFAGQDSNTGQQIAGALRLIPAGEQLIAIIYRSTPQRWPLERALVQGLLAASGPVE